MATANRHESHVEPRSSPALVSVSVSAPEVAEPEPSNASQSRFSRKRAKRACDKCSILRSRCDGNELCQHCRDYGFVCSYSRQRKKRGRKNARTLGSSAGTETVAHESDSGSKTKALTPSTNKNGGPNSQEAPQNSLLGSNETQTNHLQRNHSLESRQHGPDPYVPSFSENNFNQSLFLQQPSPATAINNPLYIAAQGAKNGSEFNGRQRQHSSHFQEEALPNETQGYSQGLRDINFSMAPGETRIFRDNVTENLMFTRQNLLEPVPVAHYKNSVPNLPIPLELSQLDTSPQTRVPCSPLTTLPRFGSISQARSLLSSSESELECRFPVLRPLLPFISKIISTSEACDLLQLYFTEPTSSIFQCASPYVLTQIFRKDSFLRKENPRKTSPSLLAAMLFTTAQTSDAKIFKTCPRARMNMCEQLYMVCISQLDSGLHGEYGEKSAFSTQPSWDIGDPGHAEARSGAQQPVGALDDVLTFMLLSIVISGGHYKGDSLKWSRMSWTMAKDLKMNREQEDFEIRRTLLRSSDPGLQKPVSCDVQESLIIEEAKEERRRTWWLLYILDRHLALSFNSTLNISDAECSLYQPLSEELWQSFDTKFASGPLPRYYGPSTTITGVGLYEYFLPLMAILGDIVELHHQSFHPRFSVLSREAAVLQVEKSLETYEASLKTYEDMIMYNIPDMGQALTCSSPQTVFDAYRKLWPWSDEQARLKTVIGYSNHLLHVLHILLHGSWDPVGMLDSDGQWATESSFIKCATHAISAASAVSEILKFDPELNFMPYLFGIYLMHGSFVLLIFADSMEVVARDTVSQACETIIRAHEVCVATLNTEYQRNFRKVIRSALCNMRGMMGIDIEQHKTRRREFLSLYRWTKDGTGLAI